VTALVVASSANHVRYDTLPAHHQQFSKSGGTSLNRDDPRSSRFFTRKPIHRQQPTVGESPTTGKRAEGAQVLISATNLQILKMSNAELATSYAALILADDGVDITVRFLLLRDPANWSR
jgi:hypothetical protein